MLCRIDRFLHLHSLRASASALLTKNVCRQSKRLASHFNALRKGDKNFLFQNALHDDHGDVPTSPLLLKQQKESFARELLQAESDLSSIFGERARNALAASPPRDILSK